MTRTVISSATNPRIKQLVKLRQGRARREAGVVLIEGREELRLATGSGIALRELYVCPELMDPAAVGEIDAIGRGAEIVELSRSVFEKAAYREGPDGWLGVAPAPAWNLGGIAPAERALLLVIEGVEKPGNVGAMLRSADAAGVNGVIVIDPVTDMGNPNIIRSSKGTLFSVPVAVATREEALSWLQAHNVALLAATPAATDVYSSVDMTGAVAIAVGAEKPGLTDALMNQSRLRVRIPMAGKIDSLNVATSAALLLFEAVRQRAQAHSGGVAD